MEGFFTFKNFLRLLAVAIVLAAVIILVNERIENSQGYEAGQVVEVTRIIEQTVLVTRVVDHMITATPQPQITNISTSKPITDTPSPTNTVTAVTFDVLESGMSIYCQPQTSYSDISTYQMGIIPEDAVKSERVNDSLTVITPVKSCTFLVAFNGEVPDGVYLRVLDLSPDPFVNLKMKRVDTDHTMAYASTDHYYLMIPPYWEVSYIVSVVGPNNEELWNEMVVFKRSWIPAPCPDGTLPDVNTLSCE